MIITKLKDGQIKVTPENELDMIFWSNIKKEKRELETKINTLKRENKILLDKLKIQEKK